MVHEVINWGSSPVELVTRGKDTKGLFRERRYRRQLTASQKEAELTGTLVLDF